MDPKAEEYAGRLKTFRPERPLSIMEVCGTHTVAIRRHGLQQLLPDGVRLISGPGCPVCVTPDSYIDDAIFLARRGFVIATFGDMVRVPGSETSLQREKAEGADIRIVYSPMEALDIARQTPGEVAFLSVGFETTVPGIAVAVQQTLGSRLTNLSFLAGNRLVPPALDGDSGRRFPNRRFSPSRPRQRHHRHRRIPADRRAPTSGGDQWFFPGRNPFLPPDSLDDDRRRPRGGGEQLFPGRARRGKPEVPITDRRGVRNRGCRMARLGPHPPQRTETEPPVCGPGQPPPDRHPDRTKNGRSALPLRGGAAGKNRTSRLHSLWRCLHARTPAWGPAWSRAREAAAPGFPTDDPPCMKRRSPPRSFRWHRRSPDGRRSET